ncbi:MAG: hypothetical protein RR623_05780 [Bacilli bacterium]
MIKKTTLLLFTCLMLTGCNKQTVKKAQENLENAKNYTANVQVEIKSNINNKDIDFKRLKKVNVDNINGTAKVKDKIESGKENKESTYYIKTNKDLATTFKNNSEITENKDQISIYYITAFINENSHIVQKEKCTKGTCYVISLKKDRVESFIKSYYDPTFFENEKYEVIDDVLLHVRIDKKGNIRSITGDFTDGLKCQNEKNSLNIFKLKIDYKSFNNSIDVKIPKKILENSSNDKLENVRQHAIDYINEVNALKLGNTTTSNTLGYTITKSDLTVVDSEVESGYILIEGYKITIKDKEVGTPEVY